MFTRRGFLAASLAAPAILRGAALTSKERVERALKGEDVDRNPFTHWHHFLDEIKPAESHAQSTLAYHEKFKTDLVKVMSDYPYPKAKGAWHELKPVTNPFPQQIRSLELIRDGLGGRAPFVETIFDPWYVCEHLSSRKDVIALKDQNPQQLLDALEAIAKSEADHARRAIAAGASGILLAINSAQQGVLTETEYAKFAEPFDRIVLDPVKPAPLNVLHLHTDGNLGDKLYIQRFYTGWPAAAINYSLYTGVTIADLRAKYSGVIMAGLDERKYKTLQPGDLKRQWMEAGRRAGKKFILAPGCSVPNDSTDEDLVRLAKMFGA